MVGRMTSAVFLHGDNSGEGSPPLFIVVYDWPLCCAATSFAWTFLSRRYLYSLFSGATRSRYLYSPPLVYSYPILAFFSFPFGGAVPVRHVLPCIRTDRAEANGPLRCPIVVSRLSCPRLLRAQPDMHPKEGFLIRRRH
jgi:hypothetical protein